MMKGSSALRYSRSVLGKPYFIVDAFTDRAFHGNPCLVVPDATGIDDQLMQSMASELRMEAAFVLPPSRGDADLMVRFFTRREEVNMSGHATVAVYAVVKQLGTLGDRAFESLPRIRQETRSGVITIELSHKSEVGPWVTIDFVRPTFGAALDPHAMAKALRLRPGELVQGLVPRVVTSRVPVGVVATVGPSTLAGSHPDMEELTLFSRRHGILGVVVFACPGMLPGSDVCARFFFPAVKPQEDVVSGAALGAMCAYGVTEGLLPAAEEALFHSDQGYSLGRPNRARILVRAPGGTVENVKVRGRGVIAATGQF